jgi:hypothetical protein
VIADESVAQSYKTVMTDLGVGINLSKTLVSNDTYEFAKRIVHRGTEITAFPLSAMIANHKSIAALWSVTLVARERGFALDSTSIPGFVADFQRKCGLTLRGSKTIAKDLEAMRVLQQGPGHSDEA